MLHKENRPPPKASVCYHATCLRIKLIKNFRNYQCPWAITTDNRLLIQTVF